MSRLDKHGLETDKCGTRYWYNAGLLHRLDGPAVEFTDGSAEWWLNGELHCETGPAIIHNDGTEEWWINGERF